MKYLLVFVLLLCFACGSDSIPKPKAYLRLDYPEAKYAKTHANLPIAFDINLLAKNISSKHLQSKTGSYGITLEYPDLKGTIFLTYKPIENNKELLISYLKDAQKLTLEHTRKADEILDQAYINNDRKVYGTFYEVGGNAASQSQFYVTDSINHFLTGSLYFYAKPNYDSILPAAHYLKNDIRRIMESVSWK